ncbi:MAG: hotdog domain-containing protein [Nitrosomonadales bacterium]|jgi:fluoroacetyl-CoA thioesterase
MQLNTERVDYVVKKEDLASSLNIDHSLQFPKVFSTSRMIALMECAAAKAMISMLQPSELSVGIEVNINHISASPLEMAVYAIAKFIKADKNQFYFQVEAFDSDGLIGSGTHVRAIVDALKLEAKAQQKIS